MTTEKENHLNLLIAILCKLAHVMTLSVIIYCQYNNRDNSQCDILSYK